MNVFAIKKVAVAAGVVVALVAGGAGMALASGSSANPAAGAVAAAATGHGGSLATAKHRADARLAKAEARLAKAASRVDRSAALAPDRALIDAELSALAADVKAVRAGVGAATTRQQVRAELLAARPLVSQGRLIGGQIRQLMAADSSTAFVAKVSARLPALAARVAALPQGSPGRTALADLQNRLADAAAQAARITAADRGIDLRDPAAARATLEANKPAMHALTADRQAARKDRKALLAAARKG